MKRAVRIAVVACVLLLSCIGGAILYTKYNSGLFLVYKGEARAVIVRQNGAIGKEAIDELRGRYAIVIVTHSMQQAARVSQRTAFFHLGHLVEYGETSQIFTTPRETRTQDYITGRYG